MVLSFYRGGVSAVSADPFVRCRPRGKLLPNSRKYRACGAAENSFKLRCDRNCCSPKAKSNGTNSFSDGGHGLIGGKPSLCEEQHEVVKELGSAAAVGPNWGGHVAKIHRFR